MNILISVPGLKTIPVGCSVGGIMTCECCIKHSKILKIKAPYSGRFKSPKDVAKEKGCVEEGGCWSVTEKCDYYPQIQGQLGIYGLDECDLIIYTKLGIQIVKVTFNEQYYKTMIEKLDYFYIEFVLPKIFLI